jgi:iron complex transport system ATP-binding protein
MAGLLAPSTGALSWKTTPYGEISRKDLARRIAYVPQSRPLRVPLTVEHLVLLGRYPYLSAFRLALSQSDFEVVQQSLELAGMEKLRKRQLETLSGGERQSAYIAAALAQEAEILILDEPTAHLDPSHQRDIAALLLRLQRERGLAILVATHDLNFASLIADRILALRSGSAMACEPPADLLRPERLSEIFEAPFSVVRAGERPVTLLEMEP